VNFYRKKFFPASLSFLNFREIVSRCIGCFPFWDKGLLGFDRLLDEVSKNEILICIKEKDLISSDKLGEVVGLLGQLCFTCRFLIQWIASEKAK